MNWFERFQWLFENDQHGDMTGHAGFLFSLAYGLRPRCIVEFGVRNGVSTQAFLHGVRQGWGPPDARIVPPGFTAGYTPKVISVDRSPMNIELATRIREDGLDDMWLHSVAEIEFGKGTYEMSLMALVNGETAQRGIDILLFDHEHSHKATFTGLRYMWPHIVAGGYVLIHDSHRFPGVGEAINDWWHGREEDSSKLIAHHVNSIISLPYGSGMTVIQKGGL